MTFSAPPLPLALSNAPCGHVLAVSHSLKPPCQKGHDDLLKKLYLPCVVEPVGLLWLYSLSMKTQPEHEGSS